jgi:hypothetical protein
MYLAVMGWKVANVPLFKDVSAPPQVYQIDRRRVVGLTIDPSQLLAYRQWRQHRIGLPKESAYTDPVEIFEELKAVRREYQRGAFAMVNVTDKPIEESADEIVALVERRLKAQAEPGAV